LITDAIGDSWVTDLEELGRLRLLADDEDFRDFFRNAKREAKSQCAAWLRSRFGLTVDPDTMFDCQIKRIHEYQRQLLNALRIVVLYNRLRENPNLQMAPRTFFFAGKAAPAYRHAKLVVKFIHSLAATIDADRAVRGRLRVLFLPDYDVSLAQRLIPASDVSNQISTAGYEASGTSNMKFMMNGALDARHARWRNHRNGTGGGREEFLSFSDSRRIRWPAVAGGTTHTGTMTTSRRPAQHWICLAPAISAAASPDSSCRCSTRC